MLCSSSSDEVKVTARPHGTAEVGLTLKTLCARAVRTVLASRSTVHPKKTGCDTGHCGSRNGGCESSFGDGAVEHTPDG